MFAGFPGVGGYRPIDTGKHVYVNWGPLREKNIYHHPRMNPFNFEENKGLNGNYADDVCPVTLDICKRTVNLSTDINASNAAVDARIEACIKAAAAL